jgi:hypothetical protein
MLESGLSLLWNMSLSPSSAPQIYLTIKPIYFYDWINICIGNILNQFMTLSSRNLYENKVFKTWNF